MKTYTVGTPVFCDFHFSGKPRGVVREVLKPGRGNVPACHAEAGQIRVEIREDCGAYRKGEVLTLPAVEAVPCKQEIRKPGSFFRWVNTQYQFE